MRGSRAAVQQVGEEQSEDHDGRGQVHRGVQEDKKHTSREVSITTDEALPSVVKRERGAVRTIPGNEGRIVQAWTKIKGGLHVFTILGIQKFGLIAMRRCLE